MSTPKIIFFSICFLFNFCSEVYSSNNTVLRIHFLDVAEGDAVLIEKSSGETCLVDAGNLTSGFRVVQYLKEIGISRLDHVIFSHHHLDHIGGAFAVLQAFEAGHVYDNGWDLSELARDQDVYRWFGELVRQKENYRMIWSGQEIKLGEVSLKVLWPPKKSPLTAMNANSLVVQIRYGEFRCLLAGDMTSDAEEVLVKTKEEIQSDILKVAHHGEDDATSLEFLRLVSPKISIISVDEDNIRGYPSAKITQRLKDAKSQVFRTDVHGDIVVTVNKDGTFDVAASAGIRSKQQQ